MLSKLKIGTKIRASLALRLAIFAVIELMSIIVLIAKAISWSGDREKWIAAGASVSITEPVDIEQLLSLLRVWLYR